MFCGNCGNSIVDDAKFCSKCGNLVKVEPYNEGSHFSNNSVSRNYVQNVQQNAYSSSPSGFSIAALVFGIIGLQILAYIFGGIAISKAKQTGQPTGMAIAGIVLGVIWTIIIIIIAISS